MKDVIEGFLRFQKEAFPQRSNLFKKLALNQNPKPCLSPVLTAG